MRLVRIYTGEDNQSHLEIKEQDEISYPEADGNRTAVKAVTGAQLARRETGHFYDFHTAPRRQYMIYLTATVEIGLGDGSSHLMRPGDVLQAEDTTGHGHSSRVIDGGMCAIVRIDP